LSAIFRLIEAHRNEIRPQPASFAANRSGCSPRGSGTRAFAFIQAHLCLRRLFAETGAVAAVDLDPIRAIALAGRLIEAALARLR
jgi:hypothetical protein